MTPFRLFTVLFRVLAVVQIFGTLSAILVSLQMLSMGGVGSDWLMMLLAFAGGLVLTWLMLTQAERIGRLMGLRDTAPQPTLREEPADPASELALPSLTQRQLLQLALSIGGVFQFIFAFDSLISTVVRSWQPESREGLTGLLDTFYFEPTAGRDFAIQLLKIILGWSMIRYRVEIAEWAMGFEKKPEPLAPAPAQPAQPEN
jgi:hypothetical protein